MKITDVRAVMLSAPVPPERRWTDDFGERVKADTTIAIVDTDEGITGYGCAQGSPPIAKTIIEQSLRPQLLGEDPTWVERLWEKMYTGGRYASSLERASSNPIMGRRGETIAAISGVDIALWDILGKWVGQPVYRLLGACRDRIRAYVAGGWKTEEEIGEQLAEHVAKGFNSVKMVAVGVDGFSMDKCEGRVRAAREGIGPDVELMLDAHSFFDTSTAIRLAQRLEQYDLAWFEEPVSSDDYTAMAEVRAKTLIPIAAGESEFTRYGFRDMIDAGAVDFVQPDVAIAGGITECRRISALASAYGKLFSPHGGSSGVLIAASLHLAASSPNCNILAVISGPNPFVDQLIEEPFKVKDGYVEVLEGPGLGITLVEGFEKRFPYIEGPSHII